MAQPRNRPRQFALLNFEMCEGASLDIETLEYGPKYAEWVLLKWGNLKFANPKLHSFQGISWIDLHVFELG